MKAINNNAPVKCTQSITINASKQKVWSVLTNINNWVAWQTDISKTTVMGEVAVGTPFVWQTGGVKINSLLHTVEPYSRFGWTGKTFGMYAIHNWSFEDYSGQTTVLVEESMEGLLALVFKASFNKNLHAGMNRWLNLLKQTAEQ